MLEGNHNFKLPHDIPNAFKQIRPWVNHGWEMVLLAAELMDLNSSLVINGAKSFTDEYKKNCDNALSKWGWNPQELQKSLDNVRQQALKDNKEKWLASHKAFSGVVDRLNCLKDENIAFAILTTKSAAFTSELLIHLNLHPTLLYGYESGTKSEVLFHISKEHLIKGFIEDRRVTLETILNTPGINSIPCYLANWGYLKPNDSINLPSGIHLLKTKTLMSPLANWP